MRDFSVLSTAERKLVYGRKNQDGHTEQSTFWIDKIKGFPQIMSLLKSQKGHILYRVNFGWT